MAHRARVRIMDMRDAGIHRRHIVEKRPDQRMIA
jgi:hypothetical protein